MDDTGARLPLDHLFGAVLRAHRRGGLRETAAKVPVDFSHLSKWERGEREVPGELVPLLDRAYGTNGGLVTLHELIARDRARAATTAQGATGGHPGALSRQGQTRLLEALAPETTPVLTALEDLTAGVRTLVTGRDGIDPEVWERIVWEHAVAYHASRPGALLPRLVLDYGRLSRLPDGPPAALLCTAAHLAVLLAVEFGDVGEQVAAGRCWELARTAADSAGERELRAWVRARQAHADWWAGGSSLSIARLLDDAAALAGDRGWARGWSWPTPHGPTRPYGHFALCSPLCVTRAGQRRVAVDPARSGVPQSRPGPPPSRWAGWRSARAGVQRVHPAS